MLCTAGLTLLYFPSKRHAVVEFYPDRSKRDIAKAHFFIVQFGPLRPDVAKPLGRLFAISRDQPFLPYPLLLCLPASWAVTLASLCALHYNGTKADRISQAKVPTDRDRFLPLLDAQFGQRYSPLGVMVPIASHLGSGELVFDGNRNSSSLLMSQV